MLGAKSLIPILNPGTILFRNADYRAIEWIEDNIPQGETILINPFSWGYGLYAGSDGGYWISPMAGIKTIPPPALYGLEHKALRFKNTQNIIRNVIKHNNSPENLHSLLVDNSIGYVYIGKRGGILSPKLLSDSPYFKPIYSSEGTWVFKIQNPEI